MVQVEYHVGAEDSIEYLKIWAANSRGYQSLVCDYAVAVHRPNGAGAHFSNGFHSRDLGRFLDSILMNQNLFAHGCRANSNTVIHIKQPTEDQTLQAKDRVTEALRLTEPPPRVPRVPKAPAVRVTELREANA